MSKKINLGKQLLIFSDNRKITVSEPLINILLVISLIIVFGANLLSNFILRHYLLYLPYIVNYPTIPDIILNSFSVVTLYIIMLFLYPYAYPKEEEFEELMQNNFMKLEIFRVLQLVIFKEFIFWITIAIHEIHPDSLIYTTVENWYQLLRWITIVITILYLSHMIFNRLNTTFDSIDRSIVTAIIISILIYAISFGISWVIEELIRLPLADL